jgi:hypothetical protein
MSVMRENELFAKLKTRYNRAQNPLSRGKGRRWTVFLKTKIKTPD